MRSAHYYNTIAMCSANVLHLPYITQYAYMFGTDHFPSLF